MSDFDDLRQMREAKERAEAAARQKGLDDERQRAEAAQRLEGQQRSFADGLSNMVMSVLEALKSAVYPDHEVHVLSGAGFQGASLREVALPGSQQSREEFIAAWGILLRQLTWDSDVYHPTVLVALEFDESGEPSRFVSQRFAIPHSFEPVTSGLTRDELTHSLRKLHPAHTIS